MTLIIHIAAGSAGLLTGYLALFSVKGGGTHRRSGIGFVSVMLVMSVTGAALSLLENAAPTVNLPMALLAGYLAVTGYLAIRPLRIHQHKVEIAGAVLALSISAAWFFLASRASSDFGRGWQPSSIPPSR